MKHKIKRTFSKLTRASLSEISFRTKEELIKLAERLRFSRRNHSRQKLLDKLDLKRISSKKDASGILGDLAVYYKNRVHPRFFVDDENSGDLLNIISRTFPGNVNEAIKKADLVCQGKYDVFSYRKLDWGKNPNWHLDVVNNKRAPLVFWDDVKYLDFESVGDCKIIWELNRHQHFLVLGKAYVYTGDQKYVREFVRQIENWIEQNPVNLGINWASSLELAFRINSWIWGYYFFRKSDVLNSSFLANMLSSIYYQTKHIHDHLSYYFSPNTHLIGEGFGLFLVGTFFPEFREAGAWQRLGLKILKDELRKQVREDGLHVEQSTYYHCYTVDFYLQVTLLAERNRISLPDSFARKIEKMIEFVMFATKPDGRMPMIGDADGGKVCPIEKRDINDHRAILSTGALVFKRGDFKFVGGGLSEETIWLLGGNAEEDYARIEEREPKNSSKYFNASGILIMRSGWGRQDKHLFFDAGPFGWEGCGHSHDDFAGFELAIGEKSFILDPGTYCYTLDRDWRDRFRESRAHNVILIDGQNRSVCGNTFEWKRKSEGKLISAVIGQNCDFVTAQQKIGLENGQTFLHKRKAIFIKPEYWVIEDLICGNGKHEIEALFHLGEVKTCLGQSENIITLDGESGKGLLVLPLKKDSIDVRLEKGWISSDYGEKTASEILIFYGKLNLPVSLVTVLCATNRIRLKLLYSSVCGLGNVFKMEKDDSTDYFIFLNSGLELKNPVVLSDAETGFLRVNQYDEPIKAFLINGSYLEYKDTTIFSYPKKVSFSEF